MSSFTFHIRLLLRAMVMPTAISVHIILWPYSNSAIIRPCSENFISPSTYNGSTQIYTVGSTKERCVPFRTLSYILPPYFSVFSTEVIEFLSRIVAFCMDESLVFFDSRNALQAIQDGSNQNPVVFILQQSSPIFIYWRRGFDFAGSYLISTTCELKRLTMQLIGV